MMKMNNMMNLGITYEKVFHDLVLPQAFKEPHKWIRVGSSIDKTLGGWSYDLPDYHIEGSDVWVELKTVSKSNSKGNNFSLSVNEYVRFSKLIQHENKVFFVVHKQNDAPFTFSMHEWTDVYFKNMDSWWLCIPKKPDLHEKAYNL